jgi:hypothetical protein
MFANADCIIDFIKATRECDACEGRLNRRRKSGGGGVHSTLSDQLERLSPCQQPSGRPPRHGPSSSQAASHLSKQFVAHSEKRVAATLHRALARSPFPRIIEEPNIPNLQGSDSAQERKFNEHHTQFELIDHGKQIAVGTEFLKYLQLLNF